MAPYLGAVAVAAAVVRWRRCAPHATWTRWLHGVHVFIAGGLAVFGTVFRIDFDPLNSLWGVAAGLWFLTVLLAGTVSVVTVVVWIAFRLADRRPKEEVVDMAVAGVSVVTLLPVAFCWVFPLLMRT
ncbi:MAG TPA: hypothetical protein VEI02_10275 [Planctomycetota bacterium]|nr:hypothetical protein [Planctomycetota bacterium]